MQPNNDFDPTSIGAMAVTASSFDPASIGATPVQKQPGFIQSMVQGIAHPFLEVASSGNALLHAADQPAYDKIQSEGTDFGYFGKAKPVGSGFDVTKGVGANAVPIANAAGTGLELGSFLAPVGEAGNVVKAVGKGAIGKAIATGMGTGAVQGTLYGAGSGLEDPNPTVGGVASNAAVGGALGAATGGALGAGGAVAGKVLGKTVPVISSILNKGVKQTAQDSAQNLVEDAVRNTAKKYPSSSGRTLDTMETINKTDPVGVIGSYAKGQALPDINEGGKVDATEAKAFLKGKIGELSAIKNDVVDADPTTIKVPDFQSKTNEVIDSQNWSSMKKQTVKAQVKKVFDGGMGDTDGNLPLKEVDKIKTEQTGLSKAYNNPGKNAFDLDAHGVIGKAARTIVEDTTNDAPTRELNKLIQSHYDAVDLLESIEGKAPHGGMLTKQLRRLAGETVGGIAGGMSGHPILGAGMGRIAADTIDGVLNNRFISNPLKNMLIKNMRDVPSDVVQRALDYINNVKSANGSRLALPAAGESSAGQKAIPIFPSSGSQMDYIGADNAVIPTQRSAPVNAPSSANAPSTMSMATKTSMPKIIPQDEPYVLPDKLPVIQMGRKAASKFKTPVEGMPTIQGKASTGALIGTAAAGAGAAAATIPSKTTYQNSAPKPQAQTPVDADKFMAAIAKNETGIVKGNTAAYLHKNTNGTKDIGTYGVNEKTLEIYDQKYLGKNVTMQQFRKDPALQKKFIQGFLKDMQTKGITDPGQLMALWHNGWSNPGKVSEVMQIPRVKKYVNNGTTTYGDRSMANLMQ